MGDYMKTVEVCGKSVTFKATAATPRAYRMKFGRDLFGDLTQLLHANKKQKFAVTDLEVFENVAYIMAKQADSSLPDDIDEWLNGFDLFAIYDILPTILGLWTNNLSTVEANSKKKNPQAKAE